MTGRDGRRSSGYVLCDFDQCGDMKHGTRKRIYCYGKRSQIRPMLEPALSSDKILPTFYSSHEDCLEKLSAKPCDILIVDLEEGDSEGLELLVQVQRMAPWVSTVALVEKSAVPMAVKVIRAGASECLAKPLQADRLCEVVQALLNRMASLPRSHRALTQMEIQIIQLIVAGETSEDIGARLRRSKRTIDVHRKNIMCKLQASSLVDLMKRALVINVNYCFSSATIISSVGGAPYRGLACGCYVSLSFRFLASSAR